METIIPQQEHAQTIEPLYRKHQGTGRRSVQCARDFMQAKGSCSRKLTDAERARVRNESRVRDQAEYLFGMINYQFKFPKITFRVVAENTYQMFLACTAGKLMLAERVQMKRSVLTFEAIEG